MAHITKQLNEMGVTEIVVFHSSKTAIVKNQKDADTRVASFEDMDCRPGTKALPRFWSTTDKVEFGALEACAENYSGCFFGGRTDVDEQV